MSSWKETSRTVIDGIELVTEERTDSRNHHGATEYIVTAKIDGLVVTSRRVPWNVWLGHNFGSLLLPEVAEEAKRVKTRQETTLFNFNVATELNLASRKMYVKADLVIAVCGDQSYIIKSRKDAAGLTPETPRRPDTVIAYYPSSRDINEVARTEVLHLRGMPA